MCVLRFGTETHQIEIVVGYPAVAVLLGLTGTLVTILQLFFLDDLDEDTLSAVRDVTTGALHPVINLENMILKSQDRQTFSFSPIRKPGS